MHTCNGHCHYLESGIGRRYAQKHRTTWWLHKKECQKWHRKFQQHRLRFVHLLMASVAGVVTGEIPSGPFRNQIRLQTTNFGREFRVQRLQTLVGCLGPILSLQALRWRTRTSKTFSANVKNVRRALEVRTQCGAGPRVAVIGAGPAGLAAALALRKDGVGDVKVYERSAELRPHNFHIEKVLQFVVHILFQLLADLRFFTNSRCSKCLQFGLDMSTHLSKMNVATVEAILPTDVSVRKIWNARNS